MNSTHTSVPGKKATAVRTHITLDPGNPPEFDSFTSMLVALHGARWSITNSSLGESLTDVQQEELFRAFQDLEAILDPLKILEDIEASREAVERGILVPVQGPFTTSKVEVVGVMVDEQPVAQMVFHEVPMPGAKREVQIDPEAGLELAVKLIRFVQQVGHRASVRG